MILKLVSGDRQNETRYECDHITIKRLPDRVEVGVVQGRTVTMIVLPDDGDVIYQMNNEGKTVDKITAAPFPDRGRGEVVDETRGVAQEMEV